MNELYKLSTLAYAIDCQEALPIIVLPADRQRALTDRTRKIKRVLAALELGNLGALRQMDGIARKALNEVRDLVREETAKRAGAPTSILTPDLDEAGESTAKLVRSLVETTLRILQDGHLGDPAATAARDRPKARLARRLAKQIAMRVELRWPGPHPVPQTAPRLEARCAVWLDRWLGIKSTEKGAPPREFVRVQAEPGSKVRWRLTLVDEDDARSLLQMAFGKLTKIECADGVVRQFECVGMPASAIPRLLY